MNIYNYLWELSQLTIWNMSRRAWRVAAASLANTKPRENPSVIKFISKVD